jgi:hypothetical protein
MITKENYLAKINRERKRVTENVIDAIKTHIETCADGMPIVEEYTLTDYQAKYFDEKSLYELENEYPFLTFETSFTTIKWGLK